MNKKKPSLGRDVFGGDKHETRSQVVKRMLENNALRGPAGTKEIPVTVKLTPSNLKHLDVLRSALHKEGKGKFTRNELIRIAITLLSVGDF